MDINELITEKITTLVYLIVSHRVTEVQTTKYNVHSSMLHYSMFAGLLN